MKSTLFISLAVAAIAGGLGYWTGHWRGGSESAAMADDTVAAMNRTLADARRDLADAHAKAAANGLMPDQFKDASLAAIIAGTGPMDRMQAILAFVKNMPAGDIEAHLKDIREQLMAKQLDPERFLAAHLLMMRWGMEDPDKAMEWLNKQDMITRGMGTVTVLATMAGTDPTRAAQLLADSNNPILKHPQAAQFASMAVAREWAKNNPAAALKWAQGLPEESRGGALMGIFGSQAAENPEAASRNVAKLEPGRDRERIVGQIAENWGAKDPQDALRWAGSLEGDERTEAMEHTLAGWANRDPRAAAAHIDTMPANERDDCIPQVAARWAGTDAPAAAAWLDQQGEGEGKKDSMRHVVGTWAASDPSAASEWLDQQPAGASKDQGIVSLARSTDRDDPAAAMTWISTISEPELRSAQLRQQSRQWMRRDESAATEWITSTPLLTAEDRTRLLPQPGR